MDNLLLFKGFIAGAIIAIPIGPIGILCLHRSLNRGPLIGLLSGLGAAAADVIHGIIAAVSISFIASFLLAHYVLFRILGGVFLIILGIQTIYTHNVKSAETPQRKGLFGAFLSTFLLTLSNPGIILVFATLLSMLRLEIAEPTVTTIGQLALGILAGSASWWLVISALLSQVHNSTNRRVIHIVNLICGIILFLSGIGTIISLFFDSH